MNKFFKYAVLKYRPSYLLDERVNIGLLFFFIEDKKSVFVFPKHLKRLKQLFPEINLIQIRKYLNSFTSKSNRISKQPSKFNFHNIEALIENEFLLKDANSFFFSEIKFGNYKSIEPIEEYFKEKYFKSYEEFKAVERHDEKYLNQLFTQKIQSSFESKNDFQSISKKVFNLKTKSIKRNLIFVWQNGSTNFVRTISFDLKEKDSIQKKSFRWYGEISQFEESAITYNLSFDLLISKPDRKELYDSYQKAILFLNDIATPKRIIEEEKIEEYVEEAIETVKSPLISNLPLILPNKKSE